MVLFHTFEGRGKLEEGEKDGMNCKEDKKFFYRCEGNKW
jgi:hypothetical protein